ncbi:hypothetical protein [Streptomyces sp. NPDC096339]|uniref:hypothetical protein n=1 Tax=Streptomyces sp. NPDC096339 TaxID=3366086 RepID=UPI00382E6B3E
MTTPPPPHPPQQPQFPGWGHPPPPPPREGSATGWKIATSVLGFLFLASCAANLADGDESGDNTASSGEVRSEEERVRKTCNVPDEVETRADAPATGDVTATGKPVRAGYRVTYCITNHSDVRADYRVKFEFLDASGYVLDSAPLKVESIPSGKTLLGDFTPIDADARILRDIATIRVATASRTELGR